jgi:hypothetical protein
MSRLSRAVARLNNYDEKKTTAIKGAKVGFLLLVLKIRTQ